LAGALPQGWDKDLFHPDLSPNAVHQQTGVDSGSVSADEVDRRFFKQFHHNVEV
jgi:hypothetical protein